MAIVTSLKPESSTALSAYFSTLEPGFSSTWAGATDAVVLADSTGKIIYANPAYNVLYGFEEEEQKDRYFDTLFQEKSQLLSLRKYQVLFQLEEETHLLESSIRWADGCERLIETSLHFLYCHGERLAIVAVIRDITGKRILQERKQLEHTLVNSERKFRAIFNQTFQFISLLKPNGTLLEANQTVLDFAGINQADVANKPFWEAPWWGIAPNVQLRLRNMVTEAAKGKLMRDEFDLVGEHNAIITVDFSLTPTKDESGKVALLIAEARDITNLKRTERHLRASEEKYKWLFHSLPVGMAITDDKGYVVEVNAASERMLGLSREMQLNKHLTEDTWQLTDGNGQAISPQELPAIKALTERKIVRADELGMTKSDKTVVWMNVTASPIPLRGYGVVLTYQDVTQNRQEKLSLIASEARYRMLFENTRYAVLRTTPEWKVLEANAEACRLFGYSEEAIKLVEQRRLLDIADAKLRASLEEGKRTGKCREEITLTKADGTPFQAELNIKSLTYDSDYQEFAITIKPTK